MHWRVNRKPVLFASESEPMNPPFWNIVSVAVPFAAIAIGALMLSTGGGRGGDYAGALGSAIVTLIVVGGVCLFGLAAAIAALSRGERMAWLSAIGILVNLSVALPALYLYLRSDL